MSAARPPASRCTTRRAARWEGNQSSVGEVGIDVGVEPIVWFDVVLEPGVRIEGVTIEVILSGKDQWSPRIEGEKIVWTDHRNAPGGRLDMGNSDIYAHDLSTGQTVAVTTHPAQQDYPDIQGDWVVWQDWRHNPGTITPKFGAEFVNADIYAKNLVTGEEIRVTQHPKNDLLPQIDRGRVFFRWAGDIYMVELAKLRAATP